MSGSVSTEAGTETTVSTPDSEVLRRDFPALHQEVHGKPLVYLDNAASTQKPRAVLDAMDHFQKHSYANVHRGIYALSERADRAYEGVRHTVRAFLNAPSAQEVVFTRGTTEAINLVAASWGRTHVREGDEIVLTEMEHHANIVPWQMLAEATGARLRVAPITCLLYTSPSPRDRTRSRMPSSA